MGDYDIVQIILAVMIFCMGLFMFFCPKLTIKKELREDPAALAKMRKGGIFEMILGILLLVLFLI